nr:MAG TPA: hypothetical protein [Caudoviricetes sp.]
MLGIVTNVTTPLAVTSILSVTIARRKSMRVTAITKSTARTSARNASKANTEC